ncbi:efflux RND transporter periplasmic adaptor subunit [Pusillimonas sp.]|uniref:efflux RND transporter periplasmic adaptor subunit n=1 Tax=Pusillimonas sp. TaxID=3040095 RepID=UPI0037C8B3E6
MTNAVVVWGDKPARRARRPLAWLQAAALGGGLLLAAAAHAQSPAQSDLPPVPALPNAALAGEPAPAPSRVEEDPNAIRVLLSPELETTLAAQVVGRIAELQAGLGARVKEGDLLLRFDCDETEARLKMAQAESAAARETLGVKQRLRKLDAAGETEVTLARIDVQRSAAAIGVAEAQLAHCKIEAPFDGRIVKVHVKRHQGVNVGAPLLELVSEGPLKLRMNVPSRLLRSVKVGSPIEVDIMETGRSYLAEVSAINARVDAVAQTIELEAILADVPPELLPGMSGVARFIEQP